MKSDKVELFEFRSGRRLVARWKDVGNPDGGSFYLKFACAWIQYGPAEGILLVRFEEEVDSGPNISFYGPESSLEDRVFCLPSEDEAVTRSELVINEVFHAAQQELMRIGSAHNERMATNPGFKVPKGIKFEPTWAGPLGVIQDVTDA